MAIFAFGLVAIALRFCIASTSNSSQYDYV